MSDYITKRLRYYDGQFLLDTDFDDEQAYHRNRQMLHERTQHLWGIAEGLAVSPSSTDPQSVVVAAGAALDKDGNRILLDAATPCSFQGIGAGTWYLVIAFHEDESDPADSLYVPGNTRFTQAPAFSFQASRAAGDVVLATLTLTGATGSEALSTLDASDRTYSGLRLNGPGDAGFDLRQRSDGTLVLANDASSTPLVYVDASGNLGITGTATLSALAPGAAVYTDAQSKLASGTLDVPRGGTGATHLTGVLKGNGVSPVSAMTGAAGRTARWFDPSTLGVGVLFDDGSKVGIGAPAPVGAMFAVGPGSPFQVDPAGDLTLPQLAFPINANPWPVITARTMPIAQGGSGSRTELILFHGNGTAGSSTITLRASSIRLQTYTIPSVQDINNNNGSIDALTIDPSGNVTVLGDLQARGPHSVAVGDSERLRIVRGTVNADGTIRSGAGFSVNKIAPGVCRINFGGFASTPTVVVTLIYPDDPSNNGSSVSTYNNAVILGISNGFFVVKTGNAGGTAMDAAFCFMIMGPG